MTKQTENRILLSVCMITYNHEKYISKAIESVVQQKTDFGIELVIGEDFSSDNTKIICHEYFEKHSKIIKLLESDENLGVVPNFIRTLKACKGKYIALCEGDDYWIDPLKLQKQVDFLENNSDYGLSCTGYDLYIQSDGTFIRNKLFNHYGLCFEKDISIEDYLTNRQQIISLTVVFKSEILKKYSIEIPENIRLNKMAGDVPLWLFIFSQYKVRYFPESTGVYRVSENTASRPNDIERKLNFQMSVYDIFDYYLDKYNLPQNINRNYKINRVLIKMDYYAKRLQTIEVLKCLFDLLLLKNINKQALFLIFASFNKMTLEYYLKSLKV